LRNISRSWAFSVPSVLGIGVSLVGLDLFIRRSPARSTWEPRGG
jgi:hypothetical protein